MFMLFANNSGADQPVHQHRLISSFVVNFNVMSCSYTCCVQNFKILACVCR